jgi:HD-like signal output (HDOD) protein
MLTELQSVNADFAKLGRLVSADMGMTAKCLQLVNSAFFGLRSKVSSAGAALQLLGQDTIRALVFSTHIFSEFRCEHINQRDIGWLWEHSVAVTGVARTLAGLQAAGKDVVDDSFAAACSTTWAS